MPKKPKEEKIYIPKSTTELLPFVCIHKGLFYMSDKSYVDIMQIVTKDLISASESEIEFDMLQFEKFYKMYAADCKGECFLVVYADDFIAGFQYPWEAEQFYHELKERMMKFGLELEESKSRMLEFGLYLANARVKQGKTARFKTFDFLGFTFYCGKTRKGKP